MPFTSTKQIFKALVIATVLVATTQVGQSQDSTKKKTDRVNIERFFVECDGRAKEGKLVTKTFFVKITQMHESVRGDADLELMLIAKTLELGNKFCKVLNGFEAGMADYGKDKFCVDLDAMLAKATSEKVINDFFKSAKANAEFVARTYVFSTGVPLEDANIAEAKSMLLDIFEEQEGYALQQFSSASDKSSLTSR